MVSFLKEILHAQNVSRFAEIRGETVATLRNCPAKAYNK